MLIHDLSLTLTIVANQIRARYNCSQIPGDRGQDIFAPGKVKQLFTYHENRTFPQE